MTRAGIAIAMGVVAALAGAPLSASGGADHAAVAKATLGEPDPVTPEVSTEELEAILAAGVVPVLDVRSPREYAIAHIPGSVDIWEKEVEEIARRYPDRTAAVVLYCNGPYCGKSRRTSAELLKRGYTNVRRYQLGLPVWRALGRTVQTDLEGYGYVMAGDRTAVLVDARAAVNGAALPGAVRIQRGEAEAANEDGRLPNRDKGTRVIVVATTAAEARAVAEEIAHKAYWNSSYFGGSADDIITATPGSKLYGP